MKQKTIRSTKTLFPTNISVRLAVNRDIPNIIEQHEKDKTAELTACATVVEVRSIRLQSHVLRLLEEYLRDQKYISAYSMAQARSYGIIQVFFGLGHEFMGRLVNNCDIFGAYEDMNIWCRKL